MLKPSSEPVIGKSWLKDLLLLTLFIGIVYFIFGGTRPLFVPDEGRYAEIAREMVASSDYLTPHLDHIKYFEKPVLFYWLEAASIKIAGLNLWSLRSINLLLSLFGCILTYYTARKLYDRSTGLLAALILATSTLYFAMAHMISLDLPVTVFIAASLYAFLLATELSTPNSKRRFYMWSAAVASALAVLTKGLIGIVFPLIIIGLWISIINEWRILKRLYLPSSIVLFFLIVTPWHVWVALRNPEFFYFYFIEQHFLRYTNKEIGHYQPVWFFFPVLIVSFFPWVVFLAQTLWSLLQKGKELRTQYKNDLFFLLWVLFVFTFFSFSKSKLIPYILPIFPPLAILTAHYLQTAISNRKLIGIKIGYGILILFSIALPIVIFLFLSHAKLPNPTMAKIYLFIACLFLLTGTLCSCLFISRNPKAALGVTSISSGLFLVFIIASMTFMDTRSILPLATILKSRLHAADEVITFNQYYQDLPFYLERRVTILNWRNELSYGMQFQDTHDWLIDSDTFKKRWHGHKIVYAVMGNHEYETFQKSYPNEKNCVLGQTITNILITNCFK